ncbi:glycerol-3-phosphate 1-O-acyltransferase PlsY [Dinoroseobacter sp. S375]|uniref:glycerol-3-phosphate 1-O-acyltransferase PlsY n=1 Tax=Dinoroseobacter sp. S375 TaxID=3415136 RepID=UPI003C7ABC7E
MIPEITTAPGLLALVALAAYLLGAVPFGMVIAKLMGLGNLREIGSGNIGATNVLRTGSKPAAAATLILDAGKGAVAVLIARAAFGEDAAQLAGAAAFLGHCFPVYLKFKGGKGVATFLGTLLALAWPLGVAACLIWLLCAAAFRFSSLSALIAALMTPVFAWGFGRPDAAAFCTFLGVLIWIRHRENIIRLLSGSEPKIGAKKKG